MTKARAFKSYTSPFSSTFQTSSSSNTMVLCHYFLRQSTDQSLNLSWRFPTGSSKKARKQPDNKNDRSHSYRRKLPPPCTSIFAVRVLFHITQSLNTLDHVLRIGPDTLYFLVYSSSSRNFDFENRSSIHPEFFIASPSTPSHFFTYPTQHQIPTEAENIIYIDGLRIPTCRQIMSQTVNSLFTIPV